MPTYQYACTEADCGHRFELVQSFTDPAASQCPVCTGRVRKVYGSVGVVFKGSGFYRTDSRSDGRAAGATNGKAESKSETTSDAKSGSSDSKPAAKSESSSSSSSPASVGSSASSGSSGSKAAAN